MKKMSRGKRNFLKKWKTITALMAFEIILIVGGMYFFVKNLGSISFDPPSNSISEEINNSLSNCQPDGMCNIGPAASSPTTCDEDSLECEWPETIISRTCTCEICTEFDGCTKVPPLCTPSDCPVGYDSCGTSDNNEETTNCIRQENLKCIVYDAASTSPSNIYRYCKKAASAGESSTPTTPTPTPTPVPSPTPTPSPTPPMPILNPCLNILTFGANNTSTWETNFNVHYVRAACSGEPTACINTRLNPQTGSLRRYDRLFLGISRDPYLADSYALEYSKLSLTYPKLYEIGFDDFYTFWKDGLKLNNTALKTIIDNTKKINSNLKFGITLYNDEIPLVSNITSANRAKINYVHLYPHFRQTDIEGDIKKTKALFPNATIIAGSYAFDFKSRCTKGSTIACSGLVEYTYFIDSFQRQVNLLKSCQIGGIEFWPAYFGNEDKIDYTACLAKGQSLDTCITNTVKMRNEVNKILNTAK